MKTSKMNKRRRQQQQSGRPVLVTFYVIQPRRDSGGGGGARATSSSHDVRHRHPHRRQDHHHHLHGGRHDERRRWDGSKYPDNRRADLLEYSRQLRALARQPTTAAAARPPATTPRRRRHDTNTAVADRGDDEGQPAAVHRLERVMSQPQIRQSCFGGDWWSWKRVLVLIFPIRSKPRGPRRRMEDGDDSEKNRRDNNQKGWSAALPVGKLTVAKTRRDHGWFAKKLMSVFQKQP